MLHYLYYRTSIDMSIVLERSHVPFRISCTALLEADSRDKTHVLQLRESLMWSNTCQFVSLAKAKYIILSIYIHVKEFTSNSRHVLPKSRLVFRKVNFKKDSP
jgi:hypothetical protein